MAFMISFMVVLDLISWSICFGCHAAFGLLVASNIYIMMLVDIIFWSMMLEMILAYGS